MKKLYYLLIFGLFFTLSNSLKAQAANETLLIAYPNPTQNSLYLKTDNESIIIESVTFYSILGRAIATYKVNSHASKISLDALRRGKYLMKYTLNNGENKVKQIIKQ